jgi:hypothetical protein
MIVKLISKSTINNKVWYNNLVGGYFDVEKDSEYSHAYKLKGQNLWIGLKHCEKTKFKKLPPRPDTYEN